MQSLAAISDGVGNFIIDTLEVGEPQRREVRVKIMASGVCHTDFDSMNWKRPLIMGHEGAGIVESVGPDAAPFAPGDRVLLNWAIPCGLCFQCLEGNQSICENKPKVPHERSTHAGRPIERSFGIGTMSQYTVVPVEALVKIDIDIPFPSAAIVGCGVMTGYGSVVNAARLRPGSSAVILGTGGVGLNVIQGARIAGAGKIIAVDINPTRLEMAKRFGATHTILADRQDVNLLNAARQVKALTGGRGADYAFECTARPELGAAPLAMVRNAGTAVQVSGIEQEITIDMNLFEWDKIYINPLYGKCRPQIDLPRLLELYEKDDLLLDELVTQTYPLAELGRAFQDMHHGVNAKGVLLME